MGVRKKTLNKGLFTILKSCFFESHGSFSLESGRTLQPICEAMEFLGKRLEGGCLVQ
jgi:hypothetical protein